VVVLLRALGDIETYEQALQLEGLRTLATAGGFWGRQEVVDLLAYLRLLANPLDELALYGALAGPLAGVSSDALALLALFAQARGERAWSALRDGGEALAERLQPDDRARLAAFAERVRRERAIAPARSVSRLLERALSLGGYAAHVRALPDAERRMANVHKLLRLARRFEASEGRDLRGFLDHVGAQEALASSPEPEAPIAGGEPDAVRLMSIHAAKGLEFPVVCVADLGRTLNLSVPDLLVEGERVGLRLARLDGSEAEPTLAYQALSEERKQAQAEEEERILYVAMTRARERLLLSAAVTFERWPEPRQGAPTISWLGPALVPELPELARALADGPDTPLLDTATGGENQRVQVRLNGGAQPSERAEAEPARAPEPARAGSEGAPNAAAEPSVPALPFAEQLGTLSYTTLSELRRCAYRFYLKRLLGLEERGVRSRARDRGDGLDARDRGAIVHRLLEDARFDVHAAPGADDAAAAARALGVRASRRECEEMASLAAAATAEASAGAPGARLAAAADVRREHPFAFSLGAREPLFVGVIDALAREADGNVLVVDYKSDRVAGEVELRTLVESDYELQRLIYALAVLRTGAASVEIVHWFLERPHEWVSAAYADVDRPALEERLRGELESARTRGFAVSEHPHRGLCETCPGRGGLCSWSEAETMREAPSAGPSQASA